VRRGLPELARDVLAAAAGKMERLGRVFAGRRALDCVGAGAGFGTSDETSLLIRETLRIPAVAYDTRHYLRYRMSDAKVPETA
jgi:glucosamine--fructose-6-phosphate aminotransferase (isomerizing)